MAATFPSRSSPSRQVAVGGVFSALKSADLTPRAALLCALTGLAMIAGGGGSAAPGSELVVELGAAAALVLLAWSKPRGDDAPISPAPLLIVVALLLALPILQLVPLPPGLWHQLPGRDREASALALVGAETRWMPLSLSPARTLASLLALVPPALAFVLAASSGARGRFALLAVIALVGLASLLLGALQLADGIGRTWRFYADNPGYLNGFQANRNAQADILLIGAAAAVAIAALLRPRLGHGLAVMIAILGGGMMLLGCGLTGSRAGIALIPIMPLLAVVGWRGWDARSIIAAIVVVGALAVALPVAVTHNQVLGQVAGRFTGLADFRGELWLDTRTAIAAHWPAGSGVGTFKPIFIAAERLAVVDPTRPVRAHNDYLEFLLEGGIAGCMVIVAAVATLGWLAWRAGRRASRREERGQRPTIAFCATVLAVIALHSVVDYPLRSMALAHLAAIAAGLLMAIGRPGGSELDGLRASA